MYKLERFPCTKIRHAPAIISTANGSKPSVNTYRKKHPSASWQKRGMKNCSMMKTTTKSEKIFSHIPPFPAQTTFANVKGVKIMENKNSMNNMSNSTQNCHTQGCNVNSQQSTSRKKASNKKSQNAQNVKSNSQNVATKEYNQYSDCTHNR